MVSIQFGLAIIIQCVSIVLGAGVLILLSIIYDACNRSMSYFSNPWILFGIYYCPLMFCLGLGCALHITFYKKVFLQNCSVIETFLNDLLCVSTEGDPYSYLCTALSARPKHISDYSNIGDDSGWNKNDIYCDVNISFLYIDYVHQFLQ